MIDSSKAADAGTSEGGDSGPVVTRNGAPPFVSVEIPVNRVMALVRGSPAWEAIVRNIGSLKPGHIIPVSQEELDSLREDCLILDVLPSCEHEWYADGDYDRCRKCRKLKKPS